MNEKTLLIGTDGIHTRILYHRLKTYYPDIQVIFESSVSKKRLIKHRIKKLGILHVSGQIIFQLTVPKLLKKFSKRRTQEILEKYNYQEETVPIAKANIHEVDSINSVVTREHIAAYSPTIIFINGTRIISKKTLQATQAMWVNIHVGITPEFRGVHGGYWSLANKRKQLFGVTIHRVDAGVDTGTVIAQKTCEIQKNDNFSTYPLLQYCLGVRTLEELIRTNKIGGFTLPKTKESQLHYHPTIWKYLFTFLKTGVK